MTSDVPHQDRTTNEASMEDEGSNNETRTRNETVPPWKRWFGGTRGERQSSEENNSYRSGRTLGILRDKQTHEVPGESIRSGS